MQAGKPLDVSSGAMTAPQADVGAGIAAFAAGPGLAQELRCALKPCLWTVPVCVCVWGGTLGGEVGVWGLGQWVGVFGWSIWQGIAKVVPS